MLGAEPTLSWRERNSESLRETALVVDVGSLNSMYANPLGCPVNLSLKMVTVDAPVAAR